MNTIEHKKDKNGHFGTELISLFKLPWKPFNLPFFLYLLGIIIAFGGLGIWTSIYQASQTNMDDGHLVAYNISTFFMAIWVTAYIDLDLIQEIKNKIALRLSGVIFFGIIFFLFWLTYQYETDFAFIPASLGFLISIIVWYLANASNEKFNEEVFAKFMRDEASKHGKDWGRGE